MRILVVGAGAVGGYFGGLLAQAGRDVTFLVRERRAELLREHGLTVHTLSDGDIRITPRTVTARTIDGPYDLIILSVKAYGLAQAESDLAAAVGARTMILPVLNGIRHIDALAERFGREHVIGGVCVVATQLDADGSIRQLGPGAGLSYGELDGSRSERIIAVDAVLSDAGFSAKLSETIELGMWEKWLLLASGGAVTTLLNGTVGEIMDVPGGSETALAIIAECAAVASASGFAPRASALERTTGMLTETGSSFSTSMFRDLQQGRDVEADQILGDLVERARHLAVPVPLLTAAYARLGIYRAAR